MTIQTQNDTLKEVQQAQALCSSLMKMPHFAKMGEAGMFAIIQKAKSMNIEPLEALNGGMYFVQGKVEMQGQMMLSLIRQAGHSVSMDPKSTDSHVIMYGKRKDNGDMWTVSFSLDDAKKAGIYRGQWEKYPKIMCQWRCVSMLARFLFPDVIKGCYVQGEISEAVPFNDVQAQDLRARISDTQSKELQSLFDQCDPDYQSRFMKGLARELSVTSISDIPSDLFDRLKTGLTNAIQAKNKHDSVEVQAEIVEESKKEDIA